MKLIATEGYAAPSVVAAFARARHLCQLLDRPAQLTVVLVGQVSHHFLGGELVLACQESKEVLQLGEARNEGRSNLRGCSRNRQNLSITSPMAAFNSALVTNFLPSSSGINLLRSSAHLHFLHALGRPCPGFAALIEKLLERVK
jgi:hypothetical protein